jgi:hypothetical protein
MVRTGLFMNEDGNVFSACMTCEGELGRLLDGRKNEPLVPPAFITSAVLKSFAVPLGSGSDASKSAASLQEQSSSTAPHRHSALCPGAGYAGRDGNRALPSPGRGNRAKPGTPGRSTRYPSIRHESGTRPVSDAARIKSPPEPTVPALRDAFMNGREWAGERRKAAGGPEADHPSAPTFQAGAEWVRRVLVPAIERANTELQPVDVAFKLDLNLDPRSTNHAHADFWLSELGEGQRAVGPKYSINVLGGQNVWLYKPGVPGQDLGNVDRYGLDEIEMLLQDAAEEFGMMAR